MEFTGCSWSFWWAGNVQRLVVAKNKRKKHRTTLSNNTRKAAALVSLQETT